MKPEVLGKYGAEDWDRVRKAFGTSLMADVSLNSLAQNLDLPEWPIEGVTEFPSKYIDLTFEELATMPGLAEHPERIQQLVTVLKETLAFDEPFSEMVPAEESEKENPILKNMAKLGLPENFPMTLVALTEETRSYCTTENITTLKEFAIFAQHLAQAMVVAGDFRALLNALSHVDEATLALYLPYRPGVKGLHLIEGLALTVRAHSEEVRAGLAKHFGARLNPTDLARAAQATPLELSGAQVLLAQFAASYVEYFSDDLAALQQQVDAGVPLGRLASVLNDAIVETTVTNLLKPYLVFPSQKAPKLASTPPMEETAAPKRGFFSSLTRLFRK